MYIYNTFCAAARAAWRARACLLHINIIYIYFTHMINMYKCLRTKKKITCILIKKNIFTHILYIFNKTYLALLLTELGALVLVFLVLFHHLLLHPLLPCS